MVTRDPSQGRNDPERSMASGSGGRTSLNPPDTSTGYPSTSTVTGGITSSGASGMGTSDVTGSGGSNAGMTGSTSGSSGSGSSSGSMTDKATEMAGTAKDKATEMAGTAKDKVTDVAGSATDTVDAQRDSVAGGLDKVATTLRDRADQIPGGDKTTQMAQTAAERLQTASSYIKQNEVSDMMTDVESFVRTHPTESLVVALAAGFLLGRTIRG